MDYVFGTDGIRGVANTELTPELAFKLGRAVASVLGSDDKTRSQIVVGRDTRISGSMLESAVTAGILSCGIDVLSLGVMTTPGVAFFTKYFDCAIAGIVISASHNPFQDNGLKVFGPGGLKLSSELERAIELKLSETDDITQRPSGDKIGRVIIGSDLEHHYLDHLKSTIDTDFCGVHIVVDCANGASSSLAPLLLRDLGADVTSINSNPNGTNINDGCGSTNISKLKAEVLHQKAHMGIAFDGDGDRIIAVDEYGDSIDGDQIIYICAKYLQQRDLLKESTVVVTLMSNLGLLRALEKLNINYKQTNVGDRYVTEEMRQGGYVLGGEQSGHIIFLDHSTTGDGLLTALQLLNIVKESGQTLRALSQEMVKYPQVLINVPVSRKDTWDKNQAILDVVSGVENQLGSSGRVLIRPSGTEKLLRIMIEGEDKVKLNDYANKIADIVKLELV